jgi:hypothetical protein
MLADGRWICWYVGWSASSRARENTDGPGHVTLSAS